eukprot:jgi/Botrbrau1/2986/Bobra.0026s0048.1
MRQCLNRLAGILQIVGLVSLLISKNGVEAELHAGILFTSANFTLPKDKGRIDYGVCSDPSAAPDFSGWPFTQKQLGITRVSARWFGISNVTLAQIQVTQNCQDILVAGGRSVKIYNGQAMNGCTVEWFDNPVFAIVLTNITGTDYWWSVSFPKFNYVQATTACEGTSFLDCPLSTTMPCNNIMPAGISTNIDSSITGNTSLCYLCEAADSTCKAGRPSPDTMNGTTLLYGLKATYYPEAIKTCQAPPKINDVKVPNLSSLARGPSRCQTALDYQVLGVPILGYPGLDEHLYTSCFGMRLEGYVLVRRNNLISYQNQTRSQAAYHKYRVCIRHSDRMRLVLNGALLYESPAISYFDTTLICHVVTLPHGLVPIHIDFASTPGDRATILQLWIIPAGVVHEKHLTYLCTPCGLFTPQGKCCPPLQTCSFRAPDCGDATPPPPPQPPSPPLQPSPVALPPSPLVPLEETNLRQSQERLASEESTPGQIAYPPIVAPWLAVQPIEAPMAAPAPSASQVSGTTSRGDVTLRMPTDIPVVIPDRDILSFFPLRKLPVPRLIPEGHVIPLLGNFNPTKLPMAHSATSLPKSPSTYASANDIGPPRNGANAGLILPNASRGGHFLASTADTSDSRKIAESPLARAAKRAAEMLDGHLARVPMEPSESLLNDAHTSSPQDFADGNQQDGSLDGAQSSQSSNADAVADLADPAAGPDMEPSGCPICDCSNGLGPETADQHGSGSSSDPVRSDGARNTAISYDFSFQDTGERANRRHLLLASEYSPRLRLMALARALHLAATAFEGDDQEFFMRLKTAVQSADSLQNLQDELLRWQTMDTLFGGNSSA